MKYHFLFIAFICYAISGIGQNVLFDPVSSKIFNADKYSGVKGSPFLYDTWLSGKATEINGTYTNLQLKLDVYNNSLLFYRDDQPLEFKANIIRFVFTPVPADTSTYQYFVKGLSGEGLKPEQYVQVLAEGKIGFYKSDIRLLTDVNEINAGLVKTFSSATRYFIVKDGNAQLLKKNKSNLQNALQDKEKEIIQFVSDNKLSLKKTGDIIRIVRYYNSL